MEFEFGKALVVDDLAVVPEHFRGFYVKGQDGKFALNEALKPAAIAIDGVNVALRKSRKDVEDTRKKVVDIAPWQGIGALVGLDGEVTAESLRDGIEKLLLQSKDGKVNWDKMRLDLEKGFSIKLGDKDKQLAGMSTTLQRYLVENAAIAAIAEAKGVPELLLPHIKSKVKVIQDGEDYVVRVVDAAGDPRGNGKGGFMGVKELVGEMKADKVYGRAFESDNGGGGGGKGSGSSQQRVNVVDQRQTGLSPVQKIARGLESGALNQQR